MEFDIYTIPESQIVLKTDFSFVFLSHKPFLPYHMLISPIRKVQRLVELSEQEYCDLIKISHKIMTDLNHLGTSWSYNLQDGPEAGQTVNHLHFHLIPRNKGDLSDNNEIYNNIDRHQDKPKEKSELDEVACYLRSFIK